MTTQFKREERYYVFKISDMRKHLSQEKFELVGSIAEKLNAGRAVDGKKSLQAVVVEHDWPEYERVWQMIETRMTTTRAQPFKPNNDRRFWPIPLSRGKGKNGTPKSLRCLCSCGTNYRVEVNEWHCPRCGKKCQITQQPDLSNLQPETQQQIRKWIADGTFTERAVGVMLEHEREIRETKQDEDHLINQRDHSHEIIDKLCDAVLGTDRHEWSSAYLFEDAVNEVEEKMADLEKQEPMAWTASMKQPKISSPRARCHIVENCKSCKHSLGRLTCTLANRDFESLNRNSEPPEWCPLPLYTPPKEDQAPVFDRILLERTLAAMEGVIDVADRKTVEFDALRNCIIDLTLMLHTNPYPEAAQELKRKTLTDEMIEIGARALNTRIASLSEKDEQYIWNMYSDTFKLDAETVLKSVYGIKGQA